MKSLRIIVSRYRESKSHLQRAFNKLIGKGENKFQFLTASEIQSAAVGLSRAGLSLIGNSGKLYLTNILITAIRFSSVRDITF